MTDGPNWWLLIVWSLAAVLTAIQCGLRARRQGYSVLLYASLGLLLGPAALLVTWSSTRDPLVAGHEHSEMARWRQRYHTTRERLCLSLVIVVGGALVAFLLTSQCAMRQYVAVFAGLSLAMPAPTRLLLALTTWSLSGANLGWLILATLVLPALLYFCASQCGYAAPVLGNVWRITDQLWLQQASLHGGRQWQQSLPFEVKKRLNGTVVPEQCCSIQEQEDRLAAEQVWAVVRLSPVATLTIYLVALTFFGFLLPMTQLVGFVGG